LSRSDPRPLRFDAWLAQEYAMKGDFTALAVLLSIGEANVTPLRSTWFHVIGDDIGWAQVAAMLSGAGAAWDGVVIAPLRADKGGPVEDIRARYELKLLGESLIADRMLLNGHHFFDRKGRRLRIEEAAP